MPVLERMEGAEMVTGIGANKVEIYTETLIYQQSSRKYYRYGGIGKISTVYLKKEFVPTTEPPSKLPLEFATEPFGGSCGLALASTTEHKYVFHGSHSCPVAIVYVAKKHIGMAPLVKCYVGIGESV